MPPANAAAISRVLTDIASFPTPILNRSDQQTYLKTLTSTHKFLYHSATYGHTAHDAASLRKVLANTMRHHPNPEFGIAGGNAAVDMLFEFGCEMLEAGYVEEVMRAGTEEVVEMREEEEEEDSEEEEGMGEIVVGEGSENDEDFVPVKRRLRKREPLQNRKRKISCSSTEACSGLGEEDWRDREPKKIKRKSGGQSNGSKPPLSESLRVMKDLKQGQRSDVGEFEAMRRSRLGEECGSDGAEIVVDRFVGGRRGSILASDGQLSQSGPLGSEQAHGVQAIGESGNNAKLREAIERLNRRVHTAIVQLWDEIGGMA